MKIIIAPDRILIKISKEQQDRLFSKLIKNHEGKQVELFFDVPAGENEDRRFEQAVQWGMVVAIGAKVTGIEPGDIAILDYLVDTSDKDVVGYHNGDKLLAVKANTTYFDHDQKTADGKRYIHRVGDFDFISPVLGLIRNDKAIARDPYIIFHHRPSLIKRVNAVGFELEEKEVMLRREVLAVHDGTEISAGETVIIHDMDVIDRAYENKAMQIAFSRDVIAISEIKKASLIILP